MLPKSKVATSTVPQELANQIQDTLTDGNTVTSGIIPKKSQINMNLPKAVKEEWKALFAAKSVTLTQGISFAVEHLKEELQHGDVVLTIGGITRIKK